ncbi:MAG: glycoside hydrolase family 2 protein [Actinobacteria bacterium]|nr:glycoside hydrolase family 2 protein [Actinomycetota bacterium]
MAFGIPGTVPGCVHTDLMAAGLLGDPYVGTGEADQAWVGQQTWSYSFTLNLVDDSEELYADNCDLICDGLDTVAEIRVNGRTVGTSANMHRRNAFPIRPNIGVGPNLIEIVFSPALEHAARMAELVGERPHVEKHPFNLIRKMACNFGWDWGPALITAGIWKSIGLRSWDHGRISDVGVFATVTETDAGQWQGNLRVDVQIQGETRFGAVTVRVKGQGASSEAVVIAEDWTTVELTVSDVQPWWPHSLGEQALYDVEVVFHNDVRVLDTVHRRTGFRTVELDTTPDADGRGAAFGIVINGVSIFTRGMDWIPDDCFPSRMTAERYRERVQQAKDANVDLLRVWGGGLYEQEAFYQACDELGVMVWQDFALACAAYPEEGPFPLEFEAEARDNVIRLSAYPSLVLWNGCNENLWAYEDWGWKQQLQGRTWGADYYYRLFPEIVAELDPSRPYWPGSPSSGSAEIHPNDPNYGCIHIWDVWNSRDYTGYDDYSPRFVAEFGYQGPATWATWARTLAPEDRSATSATMLVHQKANGGNTKLNQGLHGHLPQPGETVAEFDEWLFAMQVQQARAVRYGVERWRSLRGRCLGSVIWQLNDCWPVTSWAALDLGTDSAGKQVARRKPLWYAVRSAYADHLVTIQRDGSGWRAVLVNDGRDTWPAQGTLELRTFAGETLWSERLDQTLSPRSRKGLDLTGLPNLDRTDVALVATVDGAERAVRLLVEDVAAPLPPARYETSVDSTDDTVTVQVTARTFLRSLCLFPDRVCEDASTDSLLVDLFPGETHTFTIAGEIPENVRADLTRGPVLRSVTNPLTPSEAA